MGLVGLLMHFQPGTGRPQGERRRTCALLVARQGRAVRIYGAEPTGARPLVLPQAAVELLVDVWGADAGLLAAGWPVQRRWVRWGTAAPEQVSVRGVTLDGTELNQRLAAHLSRNHLDQVRFDDAVAGSDGPVATEGNWLVTAVPPPDAARFVTAGRRRMITTEAPLAPTADPHTCSMATGRQAWAFLTPIGPRRALVQAMVPGPVHDPVRFLGRLLHETGLGAQLAGSPATATVVPAAPQLLAPPCGPGWLAVGSAAVQFDPLSGSGAAQAVRTAILAAAADRRDRARRLGPAGPRALRRPTPRGLHRPSPPLPQPVPIGVPRRSVAGRDRRHRAHAEGDRSPHSPDGLRAGRASTRTATSGCAPGSSTCPTEPLPVTH